MGMSMLSTPITWGRKLDGLSKPAGLPSLPLSKRLNTKGIALSNALSAVPKSKGVADVAKILPFRRRKPTGSWDADMRSASSMAEQLAAEHRARLGLPPRTSQGTDCAALPDVVHSAEFDEAFLKALYGQGETDDDA